MGDDAQDDAALNSRCMVPNTLSMLSVEMVQKRGTRASGLISSEVWRTR